MNATFETTISGIPCKIRVDHYSKGTYSPLAETPSEYYGDFEFTVLDRKGYQADWLERKMTKDDPGRILDEYLGYCEMVEESYADYKYQERLDRLNG
jgi:hypothetical protein